MQQNNTPIEQYSNIQAFVRKEIKDYVHTYAKDNMFNVSDIPTHSHNGTDSNQLDFSSIVNVQVPIQIRALASGTNNSVASTIGGDYVMQFNGYFLSVGATVDTAGTTGTQTIDIKKNGTSILSTLITIDTLLKTSRTSTTQNVINKALLGFNIGDIFTIDVTTVHTTPAKGLTVFLNVART
jgi:hypothetical protein